MLDIFLHAEKNTQLTQDDATICLPIGTKIPIAKTAIHLGGCALNVSVGLARLGIATALVAETGDDGLSQLLLAMAKKESVDLSHVIQTPGATASFAVVLDGASERTEFVHQVVREHRFDLNSLSAQWVYLASVGEKWQELYASVLVHAQKTQAKIVFNPGSMQLKAGVDAIREVLAKTHLLIVNKEEGEGLVGRTGMSREEQLSALHSLGPRMVLVTDGQRGAYARDEEGNFFEREIIPGPFVEKTGAGDGFSSGFTGALVLGKTVAEALSWGASEAASVIAQGGGQEGLTSRENLMRIIQEGRVV